MQALGQPAVDAGAVEGLREVVIETAAPESASEAPREDLSVAIRESAERVSAAPPEVVEVQGVLFGEPPVEAPAPVPAYSDSGASFVASEAPPAEPFVSDKSITADVDTERIRRELSDASDEAAERYRQKISNIRHEASATPPAPVSGVESGRGGGIDLGKSPEEVEEISGMPADEGDDSQPFRRSRRRRVSGFYDMEEDEGEREGGE